MIGLEQRQAEIGVSIGRADFDPPLAIIKSVIYHYAEAQLINIEPKAAVLVADVDDCEVEAEVGIFVVDAKPGAIDTKG
jgi:hypothetical protein